MVTESEIPSLLSTLDQDSCDILMKYIYRSMAKSVNCPLMLKFHAQLSEKAPASIIRAMADRKTV